MTATFWAVLPPLIAIVLALITKEVYSSLLVGILTGSLLYTEGHPVRAVETCFGIMSEKIGEHAYILLFLVLLGILVVLITKSGASGAYGKWASGRIKSRRGALAATSSLGALIFVDDYFNCLTVGTVMRPVTDYYRISRQKLAYIIDATAAPVCILSPISSWAAAVSTSLPEGSTLDGFGLFLKTIPMNLYAIFTLVFVIFLIWFDRDFSRMKACEERCRMEDEKTEIVETAEGEEEIAVLGQGKVPDLILPIGVLIVSCITAMLYTGGFFRGEDIVTAFSECSSAKSLVLGSFFALVFTFVLYIPRRIINFHQFCDSFSEGFKSMTASIMILCLAWTLSGICSEQYLNLGGYVSNLVEAGSVVDVLLPVLFFVIALGLSFATGTSWGTFGILIPIAVAVFGEEGRMLTVCVSSVLAGAVCGDHISPISDTTILASAGAKCKHIEHVSTQLPYALPVALASGIGYLVAGIFYSGPMGLAAGFLALSVIIFAVLVHFSREDGGKDESSDKGSVKKAD